MTHVIEAATSGRSKCRGCDRKIAKDELRFGERQPNAFGEGEMTLWFHLPCAALKRPQPLLEVLEDDHPESQQLRVWANAGLAKERLTRFNGVEKAPTGRARCRCCKTMIAKDSWRIVLSYFEDFRFAPAGFIHTTCVQDYFATCEIEDHVRHFAPGLDQDEIGNVMTSVRAGEG